MRTKTSHCHFHVTPKSLLATIIGQKLGLLPKNGPRSQKCGELIPGIFLFQTAENLESAITNWLLDEFDEDEKLSLLGVILPPGIKFHRSPAFERHVLEPIPLSALHLLIEDIEEHSSTDIEKIARDFENRVNPN